MPSDEMKNGRAELVDHQIHVYTRHKRSLPLLTSPVRFAVMIKKGGCSRPWGLKVEKDGDVYIYPRDIGSGGVKVSLHKSGRQHIAFTEESGHLMPPRSRFWKVWREPPQQPLMMPSLKLLFPRWSAYLGTKDFEAAQKTWDRNHVLIEGEPDDDSVISVCLFITSKGKTMRLPEIPAAELAVLPVGEEKELHVVLCREHRPNSRRVMDEWFQKFNSEMDLSTVAAGELRDLMVAGDDPSGCPFLMSIPADCKRQMGGLMYKMCMQALVDTGMFSAPEAWHDLDQNIKEAWGTIEIDMLRKVPADTKSGRLVAKILKQ